MSVCACVCLCLCECPNFLPSPALFSAHLSAADSLDLLFVQHDQLVLAPAHVCDAGEVLLHHDQRALQTVDLQLCGGDAGGCRVSAEETECTAQQSTSSQHSKHRQPHAPAAFALTSDAFFSTRITRHRRNTTRKPPRACTKISRAKAVR